MFTGLIQSLGYLKSRSGHQLSIHWTNETGLTDLTIGDSVAVDGVCLTVESLMAQGFVVTTSPETVLRTTLHHHVDTDEPVNLEPALRVGDRLGGHFVSGHIDGRGHVQDVVQTAESWEVSFTVGAAIARYIVPKGSIAVNGVSLTIADCNPEGTWFKVAVIPHSFELTNLKRLRSGSPVNIETDLLGKYVAKLLHPSDSAPEDESSLPAAAPVITPAFLADHGFG